MQNIIPSGPVKFLQRCRQDISAFGVHKTSSVYLATAFVSHKARFTDPSKKIALITFTIYPDLAEIWSYFATRNIDKSIVDIYCVDSSGLLRQERVPEVKVLRFWNIEHGKKMDIFSRLLDYEYIWICDDDVMLVDEVLQHLLLTEFGQDPKIWAVSLLPRSQTIKSGDIERRAMGSYCFGFRRDIVINEQLSFRPKETIDQTVNWGRRYYDTCDFAQYQALERGYEVALIDSSDVLKSFMGTSILYLKMRTKLNSSDKFHEHIESYGDDWRKISGFLGSAFCTRKIFSLYEVMFGRAPSWEPLVSEETILEIVDTLENSEAKARAQSYIHRYESAYLYLVSLVRNQS